MAGVTAQLIAVAVDSDRLYPPEQSAALAHGVPWGQLRTIHSPCGHDGFLIEVDQVGALVRDALSGPAQGDAGHEPTEIR